MPVNYKDYHPKWKLISMMIRLRRAGNRCEKCHIHNGAVVKRTKGDMWRTPSVQEWDMIHSRIRYSHSNMSESLKYHGFTKIVLTVAHFEHDNTINRFCYLLSLCHLCDL
ncbi:MAG: hypothetical protein ACT4OJ_04335 [Bacteroidota bacterium]